jgi:hypothetical protein
MASKKLQATSPVSHWAAAFEGDRSEVAAAIEGNALAVEGFFSAGLDGSVASDTLQQKAH